MNHKTVIGGTVYESVGSSSSNLLLKCNGTARILWGNKLIDLIKNGKIASNDSLQMIFNISDESDITSDGIYILNNGTLVKLLLNKDGNIYNLTEFDLYISANTKQNLTVDLKNQALFNIGMFYNSLEEVEKANIKNGVVYVLKENAFYTIKEGVIEEFKAKLKTVEVEKSNKEEIIDNSVKIILSIEGKEYIMLANKNVVVSLPMCIDPSVQIGSINADKNNGYRLYIEGGMSYLDVDEINVRNGLSSYQYTEITYGNLLTLIRSKTLKPHQWYLIRDFQNHWKLPIHDLYFNRPILVRALTNSTLYKEGELFKDRRVKIHYDPFFLETILLAVVDKTTGARNVRDVKTRGLITWMKDAYNNEANFDFLDYTDSNNEELTTLHDSIDDRVYLDKSIFPTGSHDNKLTVLKSNNSTDVPNLKGLIISNNVIDDTDTYEINFSCLNMSNNIISCRDLTLSNDISFINNSFESISNTTFKNSVTNSFFKNVSNCVFNNLFNNVTARNLTSCVFEAGILENITFYTDLNNYTASLTNDVLLYDRTKVKSVHYIENELQVIATSELTFFRGMIVMHAGSIPIPPGWAICDGSTVTYDGVTTTTPNLVGRFIKATGLSENDETVGEKNIHQNNEFKLEEKHLPEHNHPHKSHTHSFEGQDSDTISDTIKTIKEYTNKESIISIDGGTSGYSGDSIVTEDYTLSKSISINISGTTSATQSEENTKTWANEAFRIEPNYYALLFIMKL